MIRRFALIALLLSPAAARASTAELQVRADALTVSFADLQASFAACTHDGTAGPDAVVAQRLLLDSELAALQADRATAIGCTDCAALDASIASLVQTDAACGAAITTIGSWDEES